MSMKQTLTAAMVCAFALSFNAFAKVAYDKEYTNVWFKVIAKDADLTDTSRWTKPSKGGDVAKGETRIVLDTDLDDPLVYTAVDASENLAIVTAHYQATANTSFPALTGAPQAALAVIANGADTNWYGLVKGDSANTWVKFENSIPTVGHEYDVQIEFDLRSDRNKIRYSVGGTVLGDGWYDNPKENSTSIQTVSFAGTGDIGDFCGDNVGEVTPVADVAGTSQTDGFDYTNGTLNVTLASGSAAGTAKLKVIDFKTGEVVDNYEEIALQAGATEFSWQIADQIASLVPGGTYGYELTITPDSTDKTHGSVIKTGTFVAANSTNAVNWFSADATGGQSVVSGGHWDTEMTVPQVDGNAYMIDDSKFIVDVPSVGSNNLTCVDTYVTFETMVDGSTLGPVDGAFGGFVAASTGTGNAWMALTAGTSESEWVALQGDIAPAVNKPYVIRAEVSFIEGNKQVRYLVREDVEGADFCVLTHGASQWLDLVGETTVSLTAVEMQGSGTLAKLEANVTDKALFEVNGVKYDNMEDALEAAGTNGEYAITLLTNATIEPTEQGKYEIAAGGHQYASGGKVSSSDKTIVVTEPGKPPVVRPSNQVMAGVTAPGLSGFKNINSLRDFLERNKVSAYQNENAKSSDITTALATQDATNKLLLWQDYALGIDVGKSVAPVTTPAGDTDADNITLAIPAVKKANYSGDYGIKYQVTGDRVSVDAEYPDGIGIPLEWGTGTYTIKVLFTPVP